MKGGANFVNSAMLAVNEQKYFASTDGSYIDQDLHRLWMPVFATAVGTNLAGELLHADTGEHARALAVEASTGASAGASLKPIASEEARKLAEAQRVRAAQAKRDEAMRLCRIKPVMSDGEIEACRVAYRDLGEHAK